MEAIQWAIGILVIIQIPIIGFIGSRLWAHVVGCKAVGERIARIDADVERMKEDIGTHDTGMRGEIHRTANLTQQHELRLLNLERQ